MTAADSVSQMGQQMGALHLGAQQNSLEERKDTESQYSVRTGASQASAVTYATDMLGITANTTFLLLDLRDPDEYQNWHIKEAINFPAANIARDRVIPELYRFKNVPDKLIVCYMNDERQGVQQAALLAEKETQISQLEQEKTQLSESHSAQMKNVLREKEELTVSNGQLEDRLQKADLDREQLRLKNKQQASTIASKDKLLEAGGLQSEKLKDTIKELEAQMQRAQQDHES